MAFSDSPLNLTGQQWSRTLITLAALALELGAAQVREPGAVMDGYDIRVEIPTGDRGMASAPLPRR